MTRRVETNKKNFTRFLVLSKLANRSSDNNKASISLQVGHQTGSLARLLEIFRYYSINLTKIQSLPIIGKPYEYSFHIDIEWQKYENYQQAISEILTLAAGLSVLGEYKKATLSSSG